LNIGHNAGRASLDARRLPLKLAVYRTPSHARSVAELTITAVPLVALWALAWLTFWLGYAWATPFIAIPAAGFLLRLFMIQHDCGHGTFFSRRLANDWVGRVIGVLTLTPTISGATRMQFTTPAPAISTIAASATSIR
jgi:omega-6 fatty acid desaturase (delta-12 desaturase)